jgi:hypothetical protein
LAAAIESSHPQITEPMQIGEGFLGLQHTD